MEEGEGEGRSAKKEERVRATRKKSVEETFFAGFHGKCFIIDLAIDCEK